MANSQTMVTTFLAEVMQGYHQFGAPTLTSRGSLTAPTNDTFKAALYLASATVNATTTAYSATNEASGTNYTAGGVAITNATTPASTNGSITAGGGYWTPSASIVYTTVTLSTAFDCVLIYNNTQGNRAVSVHTFGSQTITAGTFTLTMPTNNSSTGLLRFVTV